MTAVDAVQMLSGVRADDQPVIAVVRQFVEQDVLPFPLAGGDEEEVRRGLQEGQVVIGAALAERLDLKAGDMNDIRPGAGENSVRRNSW